MVRHASPPVEIVLIGGGHAHVHVLAALAPHPEMRVTLVARDVLAAYSGMLPGLVTGLYTHDQVHIDLARLVAATGARFVHGEAVGLDRAERCVRLADGSTLPYGLVSIDTGIVPDLASLRVAPEASEAVVAVKPIGAFLARFDALRTRARSPNGPRRIMAVGGGAGGVELLLAVRTRLLSEADPSARATLRFALATADEILPTHDARVRAAFRRLFRDRDIALHEGARVVAIDPGAVILAGGGRIEADAVLVGTQAAPPAWFRATGLAIDGAGFLAVGPTLQVLNDPDVFAAGDCAALVETPREKAGVYAVRAGPPLAANLVRRARGEPLRPWRPQPRHLSLISAGGRYAVASYGRFKVEGRWVFALKDVIDRRWMRRYQALGGGEVTPPEGR